MANPWMLIGDHRGALIWCLRMNDGGTQVAVTDHDEVHPDVALKANLKYSNWHTVPGRGHGDADAIFRAEQLGREVIDKFLDR
jgi:hypothetical protein